MQHGIEGAVRTILKDIGEDPDRQGLQRTPFRVAKMYREITQGYHKDPQKENCFYSQRNID